MIAIDYEKVPGEGKAEWDVRQLYVRILENLNSVANGIRFQIEMQDGTPVELAQYYHAYFSTLKQFYRNIRIHYSDDDKAEMDKRVTGIEGKMKLIRAFNGDGTRRGSLTTPTGINDFLGDLHNDLNQKRFDVGLVISVKTAERFDSTEGFDQE